MPIAFLRQLIRFYGDQMQMVIPGYLEQSMTAFSREQEGFRDKVAGNVGQNPMKMMEAQVRRNTEIFRQAMTVFNPFAAAIMPSGANGNAEETPAEKEDLSDMRRQLAEMQKRLEALDQHNHYYINKKESSTNHEIEKYKRDIGAATNDHKNK